MLSKKENSNCNKLFWQCENVHKIVNVFNNTESDHNAVSEAGKTTFLFDCMEHPPQLTFLNAFRYHSYAKSLSNIKLDISSLPSTERAARQHFFPGVPPVQPWFDQEQQAELRGCERKQNHLIPKTTEDSIAPEAVLNTFFCKCTTGC